MSNKSFMVIDPSIQKPEISSFNHVSSLSSMRYTYLLPALSEEDSMNSELQNTYGIILMGSACSVHDDLDWQKNLQDILLKSIEKEIPILGICYGHQLLAHTFGGIVGYLWSQEKKKGTRIVALRKNELWVESKLGPLIYSHQEGVISCPHDFEISATSDMVHIEGLAHLSKPIWTFQPHIEATLPFAERNQIALHDFENAFQFGTEILNNFIHLVNE